MKPGVFRSWTDLAFFAVMNVCAFSVMALVIGLVWEHIG